MQRRQLVQVQLVFDVRGRCARGQEAVEQLQRTAHSARARWLASLLRGELERPEREQLLRGARLGGRLRRPVRGGARRALFALAAPRRMRAGGLDLIHVGRRVRVQLRQALRAEGESGVAKKVPVVLDSSTAGAQHPRQGRALTHGPAPGKHAPLARRGRTAAFAEGRRSSGETDIPTARSQHAPRSAGTAAAAWCRWEAPLRRRRGRSGGETERVTGDRRCQLRSVTPVA